MKKLFATVMVMSLTAALVGCGSSSSSEAAAPAESTDAAVEEEAVVEEESKGTLIMATNAEFPPYEYHEGDAIIGIDAEIAEAIATKLGYDFMIEDMLFDSIIPAVTSGKASFGMAGMTVTEERMQSVDFSDSYATGVQVVIVAEGSAITSVDDLFADDASYGIGVQTGTTGDLYATWDLEDAGLATIDRYNKGADAVQALIAGKLDCVIIDNEPAKEFVAATEGLAILDSEYAVEEYAIAFAKDSELTEEVNGALQELIADGTVAAIIDKYISAE
ncbi:transporter substrate-binding domain-containing protein [Chakrabartyella piscis]|uniref:transporter substrate-binding domain-containing protein n=1 Tax=Chakrabartyella piscis TaxID=2918914 RepID=UPI002958C820|nr:transporter substrate-binding domain-containing protein [Chakrabartyella piscis]